MLPRVKQIETTLNPLNAKKNLKKNGTTAQYQESNVY